MARTDAGGGRPVSRLFAALSSAGAAATVDIPFAAGHRFLTLAVTESDDTHAYDWALFACPELTLKAVNR